MKVCRRVPHREPSLTEESGYDKLFRTIFHVSVYVRVLARVIFSHRKQIQSSPTQNRTMQLAQPPNIAMKKTTHKPPPPFHAPPFAPFSLSSISFRLHA